MSEIPHISELPEWPVFETPYRVGGEFGEFIETIADGATIDARIEAREDGPSMVVLQDEWNGDFTERRVLRIEMICPKIRRVER